MKTFYQELQEAEKSADERMSRLAAVCKADLEDVRKNQTFQEWEWWFE